MESYLGRAWHGIRLAVQYENKTTPGRTTTSTLIVFFQTGKLKAVHLCETDGQNKAKGKGLQVGYRHTLYAVAA